MSTHDVAIDVLVVAGVAGELLCCIGVVVVPNVFARLHYVMAATTVPPFLIAAAVVIDEGWTQPAINALVIAGALFLVNPVLATATARAARTRRFGTVEARPEERR
jgi:monovalent cation/proton antiporter MnhG/PhaG subunit